MTQLKLKAKEFKKMADPSSKDSTHIKYVCYVQANSIPFEADEWMSTNPREQKMTTNVANKIKDSLADNPFFHELNRGILMSVFSAEWDNKTEDLILTLDDPELHGNIDGGHTLRAILEAKNKNSLSNDRYVFFEIFVGIESPVELAAARNTSVQVDLKSIAELENSFEVIKDAFTGTSFSNRIQYKMNEHYNDDDILTPIDVREIIAILMMFSQEIYPIKTAQGTLSESQPIQCYSGKEASLKKFLYPSNTASKFHKIKREKMIINMKPIIKDIFELWEEVETSFATVSNTAGKRYGTRKYSKYDGGKVVGKSYFKQRELQYIIPKGILYPLVGSFRALIMINTDSSYYWKRNPIDVWKAIGQKLVTIILDEKTENPDVLAKNSNLWSNLFKEIYIYGYLA
ncbi:MAG TPA: AIPR family protein [Ruminiclostridium sp.]|nr:AIPR family protein [Ruminiclostridium sp.]